MLLGYSEPEPEGPPIPFLSLPAVRDLGWVCLLLGRHLALENGKGPGCGPQGIKAQAWFGAKFSGRVKETGEVQI